LSFLSGAAADIGRLYRATPSARASCAPAIRNSDLVKSERTGLTWQASLCFGETSI
jgi:hypothetical protein